ncbi:DMT family transporter [Acidisoma sp. C75]
MRHPASLRAAAPALGAALLFGASTPGAKQLLGGIGPWMLAGLLYLGSGLGLGLITLIRGVSRRPAGEAPLRRADLPWLAAVVVMGGALGPALLMQGLARVPAASAALLLNAEGLATMLIAWFVFHENADRRIVTGALAILTGALILSWHPGAGSGGFGGLGALLILGACLAWGVDNTLSRRLAAVDPVRIAMIKGLVAGAANLALALTAGERLPGGGLLAGAGLIGFAGYGVSLVLFMLSLRALGAARTGAYFSLAPFIGALLAVLVLGERPTAALLVAGLLMAIGLYLHLAERHAHEHEHGAMEHEHAHVHDAHHQHAHGPEDPPGEPHSHPHRHEPMTHSHAHYPDLHHRHRHPKRERA